MCVRGVKRLEFLCLSGFVQGLDGEVPVAVDFHCDYQNGALLVTVSGIFKFFCQYTRKLFLQLLQAWSSGRISFTPFVFTPPLVPSLVRPPLSNTLYSQQ